MRPALLSAVAAAFLAGASTIHSDPLAEGSEHCAVNVRSDDALSLRARPSASAPVLTRWSYGQCDLTVTGACLGDWCPVADGHYAGWADGYYLAMVSAAMFCVTGMALGDLLDLRAWRSNGTGILAGVAANLCGIALLPHRRDTWQKVRADG